MPGRRRPSGSSLQQWLESWVEGPVQEKRVQGAPVFEPDDFGDITAPPTVATVESWFSEGASVALAGMNGSAIHATARVFSTVSEAAAFVRACGVDSVYAGKSIAADIEGSHPIGGTTKQAITDLRRYLDDGLAVIEGTDDLLAQADTVRMVPGTDGPRIVSTGRADAIKAVAWAVSHARIPVEVPAVF